MLRLASSFAIAAALVTGAIAQGWLCYGGNAQHSGVYTGISQTASLVKWQASLDDDRAYYGYEVLIHYAAPMVTPTNTVVYGYRYTTTAGASPDYDNWRVMAKAAKTGSTLWQFNTDYSAALIYPNDWTTVFPITLFQSNSTTGRGVAAAAGGGSLMVRTSADTASGSPKRLVFYTTLADYTKNAAAYAPIKINTPLTADSLGNIYFGYEVTASVPSSVSSLGSGGIAKVNVHTGAAIFKAGSSFAFDTSISRPGMNAAPALSGDGNYIYVGMVGNHHYLVKMQTKDLAVIAHAQLLDPSITGADAYLINESSASPMVAPDGNVFMGVFGNQWRESHGWMLQFNSSLGDTDSHGNPLPAGSFGWDDTAVVVPTNLVPSYTGSAKYLILTKYNNYDDDGSDPNADGSNKVAVLDPTSNSISRDRQSGIPVMNEIITILGPTKTNNDSAHPDAVNEWCINSAAVDVSKKSAIINSEDGHMYRWSFVTNSITEGLALEPATGEAYTETAIGPDGTIYVINNSVLFAIGSNNCTGITTVQGTGTSGNVQDVWSLDGESYSTKAISTTAGQVATVEADFKLTASSPSTFNIASNVAAIDGVTGTLYAYNYTKKAFEMVATQALTSTVNSFTGSITTNAKQYLGPNGAARIRIQALLPTQVKTPFKLSIDHVTCGAS